VVVTSIAKQLAEACVKTQRVVVERDFPSDRRIDGFALACSDRLVLLQQLREFSPDGWTLVRLADIDEVESGEDANPFFEKVWRAERLGPEPPPFVVPVSDFVTALKAIAAEQRLTIIECETIDGEDDEFVLGRVLAVDDLRVTVVPIGASGEWLARDAIPIARITKLQIDTPYALMFHKYGAPFETSG
jgi:hypothetical protein